MAHRSMTLTEAGAMRYGTRMLTAGTAVTLSGPDARLYERLGWATAPAKRARRPQLDHDDNGREGGARKQQGADLPALRAAYFEKFGRRPFNGWDAATLRQKIAEA